MVYNWWKWKNNTTNDIFLFVIATERNYLCQKYCTYYNNIDFTILYLLLEMVSLNEHGHTLFCNSC